MLILFVPYGNYEVTIVPNLHTRKLRQEHNRPPPSTAPTWPGTWGKILPFIPGPALLATMEESVNAHTHTHTQEQIGMGWPGSLQVTETEEKPV